MTSIPDVASCLQQVDGDLWASATDTPISYPAGDHDSCLAVEEESYWFRHRNEIITRMVAQHAPAETLFDIGGGNGYVSLALQRAGIDAVVVEPGPQGIAHARARGLRPLIRSTFAGAGFRPGAVGAFGLFDVLEHVSDDRGFLAALLRCLKPGGALFLTVPACQALWSSEDDRVGHFRRYSRRTLAAALEASGFELAACGYFFCPLVPAVLIGRALPSRLGLGRGVSGPAVRRDHAPQGVLRQVLESGLAWELRRLRAGKPMPIGSSCFAVARRG